MLATFSKCRAWDMWQEFGCRSTKEHCICSLDRAVVLYNVQFLKLVIEIWALNSFTELSDFEKNVLVFFSDVFGLANTKSCLPTCDEKQFFICLFFSWRMKFCQKSTKNLENRISLSYFFICFRTCLLQGDK